eukprot:GHVT01042293.1.p1 GENE.GHVT01042293.1~~GHVT01042293.1.p1  ORF type:complete len:128 (-),score=26.92 GHVT01042293.1:18-344(-)
MEAKERTKSFEDWLIKKKIEEEKQAEKRKKAEAEKNSQKREKLQQAEIKSESYEQWIKDQEREQRKTAMASKQNAKQQPQMPKTAGELLAMKEKRKARFTESKPLNVY